MEVLGKTPVNPILFVTGKTAGYLTWLFLVFSLANLTFVPVHAGPMTRLVAWILLFSGVLLIIVSSMYLGSSVRIGLPDTKTELKQSGIYRISRNPMYLGMNLVTFASMIYTLNWLVIILGTYSIVVYHFIILGEEKFLAERFGDEYSVFKNKVRRYL